MFLRKFMVFIVLIAAVLIPASAAEMPQGPQLNVVVLEGEGAINNIKQRTARETIVQVQDENHKPVAAAAVVFLLPNDGPGGTFADGSKSVTVMTDSQGQAVMPKMQPNTAAGKFQIRVTASSQGRQTSTMINQTNAVAGGGAAGGSSAAGISGKTIGIIVAVAAAGAVGAVVGLKGGKSNNSTPSPTPTPTGTISVGSGASVGPPQ